MTGGGVYLSASFLVQSGPFEDGAQVYVWAAAKLAIAGSHEDRTLALTGYAHGGYLAGLYRGLPEGLAHRIAHRIHDFSRMELFGQVRAAFRTMISQGSA
jgi:hypothetical protein